MQSNLLSHAVSTRRRWIFGATITASTLAALPAETRAADSDNGVSHSAESIHQENIFKASPARIYEALTDSAQFQKICILSGAGAALPLDKNPAQISREPGGPFSIFGAYIIGRQLELLPGQRIVQAWRVGNWPAGIFSIAKFELTADPAGTKIIFDHIGFPAGAAEHLASGWNEHYWEPLAKFLAQS
jgi:activator of HSP90 ATPase